MSNISAPSTIGACSCLFTLGTVFFWTRFAVEYRGISFQSTSRKVSLGCALGAWILLATAYGMTIWTVWGIMDVMEKGAPMTVKGFAKFNKLNLTRIVITQTCVWLVKASFASMYFSITLHMTKPVRYTLYGMTTYVVISYLIVLFSLLFWCNPISEIWWFDQDYLYKHGGKQRCNPIDYIGYPQYLYLATVLACTSDFVVIVVPFLILRTISIQRKERMALVFLVFLGIISMIATILKVIIMTKTHEKEWTNYNLYVSQLLTQTETVSALVACSLPSLRAYLMRKIRDNSVSNSQTYESRQAAGLKVRGASAVMDLDSVALARLSEEALYDREAGQGGMNGTTNMSNSSDPYVKQAHSLY